MGRRSPAPVGYAAPTNRSEWFDYSEHTGVRTFSKEELLDLLISFDYTEKQARSILNDLVATGVAIRVAPYVYEVGQEETDPTSAARTLLFHAV